MAHIFVVEDEQRVALVIERCLSQTHQITLVSDAFSASQLIRRARPDLIISDILMAGMDGLQLCRQVRADPRLSSIPLLFLSAKGQLEDKLVGLQAGADDYLAKPFDIRELVLRVQAILRRTLAENQIARPDQLTIGDLTLHCLSYQLDVGSKTVRLTSVEFDLIYHLMGHPGQVFSSERLLREVWGYPHGVGSSELVRSHIRNLRLKLEPDRRQPRYLLTVPGYGYIIALGA